MKINILEKNYIAREKLKDLIEKKVNKFEKYLGTDATCKVVLSSRKENVYKMEVNVQAPGLFVRSEIESDNMYVNLDTCLAKIERQIVKHHNKLSEIKKIDLIDATDLLFYDEIPTFNEPKITKRKAYDLYPMSEKEALERIEMLGNTFYVFLNEKTSKVCVIYLREDGDYGFIETNVNE